MKTRLTFTFFLALTALAAQTTILAGIVTERSGEPIIGANVFLQGTYDGTATDLDGHFILSTTERDSQILLVSYLGYNTESVPLQLVGGEQDLMILLRPAATALDEVIITAGAFEASDEKKAVALRPLDIVTTAGATGDLVGALQTLPGAQRVGEDGRLFVRGGAAHETRTFIDGVYVANPYASSVPNVPARGRFSPFLFKGTTFSTGGYSAEYSQALSSALILESQDLAPESLTSLSLMSVGVGLARTQRWEETSLSVSADYTNLSPYMGLVPQNIDWQEAPNTLGGQVIFRHQFAPGSLLKVQAQHQQSGMALRTADPREVTRQLNVSLNNAFSYGSFSWKTLLNDEWSLFIGGGWTRNQDGLATVIDQQTVQTTATGKVRLSRELAPGMMLRLGGEYWYESYRDELQVEDYQEHNHLLQRYVAGFTEIDWRLTDRWVARLGLRTEGSPELATGASLSPRLSLAYKTGEHSQMGLAAGRFRQSPEQQWLRQSNDLRFETADHFLLNWQWQRSGRTLRVEGYEKRYRDLVRTTAPTPDNSGDGYARGLDVFYRDKATIANSDFWLSYSWIDTQREYLDYPQATRPPFA
ncbi:MAG: TonB-dependent receptor, partial [Lewinella sp.]|nr:TonB-dependent receptor [Lewinella sp.]